PDVVALTQQVDRGRRLAGARKQAGGAAHDLDPVVDDRVQLRFAGGVVALVVRGDAVVLQVVDREAARGEGRAFAVELQRPDAGRVLQDVAQVLQALVVDALARDDGDGLRRLPDRQRQAGRGRRAAGGVAARALGRAVVPGAALDLDGRQHGLLAG